MPRRPIDPAIVTRVEQFWAEEAHPSMGEAPSRRRLHSRFLTEVGESISWGTFNTIVRRLEAAAPQEPLRINYWRPWINPEESTEDTASLLRVNAVARAEQGRGLYDIEARWARHLRGPLEGSPLFIKYRLAMLYSLREIRAHYLQKELDTDDLDNLVAYLPWFVGNREAYQSALVARVAPYPDLDPFNTFRDTPPPPEWLAEWTQRFKHTWLLDIYRTLLPHGTHIPGIQNHPELVKILDGVVQFWGRPVPNEQSTPGTQDDEQTDINEQEHPREERLVRN
jgi:hypothetical protein